MLEIERLSAAAGAFRLDEVNLCVAEGECHAVLGPSGAGKTTLLAAVLGARAIEEGAIRLAGREITRLEVEERGIGYVPQRLGLFPHLSVRENLLYSAHARQVPEAQFRPRLERLVEVTEIGGLLDRRTQTLSGGERQRVGLVRALAPAPRLVLFDEPFTALNESLRRELWELLLALRREEKLTILFVTHDLTEAFYLADRVTILLDGRVIQQGGKEEVYDRPASPEAAAFLGYRNLLSGRIEPHAEGCVIEHRGFRIIAPVPPQGEEAVVCIRPQAIKIIHEGAPVRKELASNLFAAAIEEIVRLPEMAIVHLSVIESDGARLEVRLPLPLVERLKLEIGKRVTVALWTPAILVYKKG